MSTEIAKLSGLIEITKRSEKIKYTTQEIIFTSFYGGKDRKQSLSISIEDKYVQLDNEQVLELIKILQEHYT